MSESESVYDYMATETLGFTAKLAIRQAAMERERSKALGSLMGRLKYVSETESTAKGTEDTWSPDRVDILAGVTDDEAQLVGATGDWEFSDTGETVLFVLTLGPLEGEAAVNRRRQELAGQLDVELSRVIVLLHGETLDLFP